MAQRPRTTHKTYRLVPMSNIAPSVVEGWRAALETAFELKQAYGCSVEVYDAQTGVRLKTVIV